MSIEDLERAAKEYQPRNKLWTQREDDIIRQYYNRVALKQLAAELDRSVASIGSRVRRLRDEGAQFECDIKQD